jgi:hypothetical protein
LKKLIGVSLCLLVSFLAIAQDKSGADAALTKFVEATRAYDTARMASSMHPEALQRFRAVIEAALKSGSADLAKAELLPLFSVSSVEDFAKLSDVEMFKRLSESVAKAAPQVIELMAKSEFEILSTVVTGEIADVTYNMTITVEGQKVEQEIVQKLKPYNGQWMLLLPATAETTIANFESRYR